MNTETDAHGATYAETIIWKPVNGADLPPAYDEVLICCAEGVQVAARSEHVSGWWPAMGAPSYKDVTHWCNFPSGLDAADQEFWESKIAFELLETKNDFSLPLGFSISRRNADRVWCVYINGKHADCYFKPLVSDAQLTSYPTARLAIQEYIRLRQLGFGAAE